jgi:hypothetical protein
VGLRMAEEGRCVPVDYKPRLLKREHGWLCIGLKRIALPWGFPRPVSPLVERYGSSPEDAYALWCAA